MKVFFWFRMGLFKWGKVLVCLPWRGGGPSWLSPVQQRSVVMTHEPQLQLIRLTRLPPWIPHHLTLVFTISSSVVATPGITRKYFQNEQVVDCNPPFPDVLVVQIKASRVQQRGITLTVNSWEVLMASNSLESSPNVFSHISVCWSPHWPSTVTEDLDLLLHR